jgi:HEPN domain-containing protein
MKHLTAEWIEKAEEDFLSASHLAAAEKLTPHNVNCFLCQQTGEKWLKARLCEDDLPFPKTHDLRQLLVLLKDAYPGWIALVDSPGG